MKKTLFCGFTALLFTCAINNNNIYSQISSSNSEANREKNDVSADESKAITGINPKAIRNFNKEYKNVTDAKWFISSAGLYGVYFTSDDVQTFVYYNTKGTYEFMHRNYKEDKLPAGVSQLIKTNYSGFAIYHVTEVSRNGKVAYGVNIKDKTSWKTVKVVDGEIEVITEYTEPGR